MNKSDLFAITAAPFAKKEIDPQTPSLPECQLVVKRLGLEARRRLATWR